MNRAWQNFGQIKTAKKNAKTFTRRDEYEKA